MTSTKARIDPMLAKGEVDVVILGAGVNGAGLFRDLSEQGVDCLIVDKADFGSGASAAPSRLIHGGLKYLETGEFRLVAQSTLERNLLLKNAPHLVRPLPTLIPILSWTGGVTAALRTLFGDKTAPRSRGALLIKIGLQMYDYYGSRHRVMPRHAMVSRAHALKDIPALTPAIVALGTYYDAKVSMPERLVYELIADGLAANPGSAAANYTQLQSQENGALTFVNDEEQSFVLRPRIVVNAAGPWIDEVNARLGHHGKMIGGTKGSHLLLKHDDLVRSLAGRMIYFEADDGRICLVYECLGLALVGSTDIPADNPDTVLCEDDELTYLLQSLFTLLPGFRFDRSQVVYSYSGIRPLPNSDASIPGLISRDHSSPTLEPDSSRPFPIVSLVGGKWTTFRGFAEEIADMLLQRLGRSRKVSTRTLPIGGGRNFPDDETACVCWLAEGATATGVSRERLAALFDRYGTTSLLMARHIAAFPDERPLAHALDYSRGEIDFIARLEQIGRLADIVMRRTSLALTGALDRSDLEDIAEIAGEALGWTLRRRIHEIDATVKELSQRHSYRFDAPQRGARLERTDSPGHRGERADLSPG
jgi:glycerol-3-phosphate dehydrogenase